MTTVIAFAATALMMGGSAQPAMPATANAGDLTPSPMERDAGAWWAEQGQGQGQAQARGQDKGQGQGQAARGQAQGQARGQDQPRGQGQARAQGQGEARPGAARPSAGDPPGRAAPRGRSDATAPGRAHPPGRARARRPHEPDPVRMRGALDALPPSAREMVRSPHPAERMAAGALVRARMRGVEPDRLRIRRDGDRVVVRNGEDELLLDLDERRAQELGHWRMRRMGDERPRGNAPAFCRSGAGHPVWGRDWCIDQGFGLGSERGTIWSRGDVDDIVFRRPIEREGLDRGGLIDVLGDVVFGRLALQSMLLGYTEPLSGRYVVAGEPDAPRILRVQAGDQAVAELIDRDRDGRVEVLYVSQPRW